MKQSKINQLTADLYSLTLACKTPMKCVKVCKCAKFIATDKRVRLNTGLETRASFDALLDFVTPGASRICVTGQVQEE